MLMWMIAAVALLGGIVAFLRVRNVTIGFGRGTGAERDPLADRALEEERDRSAPLDPRD